MRYGIVIVCVLAGGGCGKGKSRSATSDPVRLDAAPAASPYRCDSADDCVLSRIAAEHDCCENSCDAPFAYHREQLAALETARQANCADKVEECATPDCPNRPDHLYPGCVDHLCVPVEH